MYHPWRFPKKVFALSLMVLFFLSTGCGKGGEKTVILISIDALRQDHLGCYGYGRETSPHLDRFAKEEGVLFEAAYAQAPYTLPSHMSMLLGLYPETHGILVPYFQDPQGDVGTYRLANGFTTLAEVLKADGFKTAAFTDGVFVDSKYGFDQGFDLYEDENLMPPKPNGFRKYGEAAQKWIQEQAGRDFFLFLHTYDVHSPYRCSEPFQNRFKGEPPGREAPSTSMLLLNLLGLNKGYIPNQYEDMQGIIDDYDGCISFVDTEIKKIFDLLKSEGRWDDALVVVTSDHGESFMENGLIVGHGLFPTNEETLIPLVMKLPLGAHAGERVSRVVESVDIMPTVLAALKIPAPSETQGQNLLRGLDEGRWQKDFAFGISPLIGNNRYFIRNGIKYIEAVNDPGDTWRNFINPLNPHESLARTKGDEGTGKTKAPYDYSEDPLGVTELIVRGDRAYDLTSSLHEWKARAVSDSTVLQDYKRAAYAVAARSYVLGKKYQKVEDATSGLSSEDMERLEALGYGGIASAMPKAYVVPSEDSREALALKPDQAPINRELMNRGDNLLFEIVRSQNGHEEMARKIEKIRSCYETFVSLHPEKAHWIHWRLDYLERVRQQWIGKKTKNDSP